MLKYDSFIDLKGVACPINFVRAKLMIDTMKKEEVLRIELDPGEAFESVTKSMTEEGHDILESQNHDTYCEILIKRN